MVTKKLLTICTLVLLSFSILASGKGSSWRLQDLKEVKCSSAQPLPEPPNEKTEPALRKLIKELKYYPYMNKFSMYASSMAARGKGITSDEEIEEACITRKVLSSSTPKKTEEIIYEFGKEIDKTCDTTDLSNIKCDIDDEEINQHIQYARRYESIIWSDYKENVLYLVCYEEDILGWHVKSKKKDLSSQKQKVIFKAVKKLGFSERKALEVSYDECE